jgi:hypothetical protein
VSDGGVLVESVWRVGGGAEVCRSGVAAGLDAGTVANAVVSLTTGDPKFLFQFE